jgi:hypothetical protein
MWNEAAGWLAKYPEVVVSALDVDGYPFSTRQSSERYDAATGVLPVALPEVIRPSGGAANLLCHSHDESLWNLSAVHVRGTLKRTGDTWVFVSSAFAPPQRLALWHLSTRMRSASRRYRAQRPQQAADVNWTAIAQIWKEIRARQPK